MIFSTQEQDLICFVLWMSVITNLDLRIVLTFENLGIFTHTSSEIFTFSLKEKFGVFCYKNNYLDTRVKVILDRRILQKTKETDLTCSC